MMRGRLAMYIVVLRVTLVQLLYYDGGALLFFSGLQSDDHHFQTRDG